MIGGSIVRWQKSLKFYFKLFDKSEWVLYNSIKSSGSPWRNVGHCQKTRKKGGQTYLALPGQRLEIPPGGRSLNASGRSSAQEPGP